VRAIRTFSVRARLPEALAPLAELAGNLRWSWDERTRELFRSVDPDGWERAQHDPVRLLHGVRRERLTELAADDAFLAFLRETHDDLRRAVESPSWFQERGSSPLRRVAYFSPEFGIAEALPQYSGGLGVLAGDHLKAAAGLGVPLVAVGLLYRHGYFRQALDAEGWQQERYPRLDPQMLALAPVDGATVSVDLGGTPLTARLWRAEVGRIPLFLLDADVDANPEEVRQVTDRLYGGGTEHRLRQELLLGVGGVRALDVLGTEPQIFHMNEGHAGFLGLERIRRLVLDEKLTFAEAVEAVRASTIFTTHTPVPAGIDRFPREMMARYFSSWCEEVGVALDDLMDLGHEPGEPADAPFNMALMGLRLAASSNAVSQLHGKVSRLMFQSLWSRIPIDEVPITSVTNGVHGRTWVSAEMNELLNRYVLPEWPKADAARWESIRDAPAAEVWRARQHGRERLVGFVRRRLRDTGLWRAASEADVAWCETVLDPNLLTIGFARRFASYKRATLLLSQPDRLRALLLDANRPIQLVFAGKAHPADDPGKELIREIVRFSHDEAIRHRFVFVEDYDIGVARMLLQGCDVWLNTPRRPLEACGTSGMKAALNGALNLSIRDGWWDEWCDGENGWAITSAEGYDDLARRDQLEADSLFALLERDVVPLFYDVDRATGLPLGWIGRVHHALATLGPRVSASRMLEEYVERMYEPAAARADRLLADGFERARSLAAWKHQVAAGWGGIAITEVEGDLAGADLGVTRTVTARVELGAVDPDAVEVQLVHGLVGSLMGNNDEIADPQIVSMRRVDGDGSGFRYTGDVVCDRAGRYGYTVRVLPSHPDLAHATELGCITFA